jgi:hypothetical protein
LAVQPKTFPPSASGKTSRSVVLIFAAQFIDLTYRELVSDPLAVVRRIYEQLDIRLKDVAAQRMQRLALSRSPYEKRGVSSTSADLGLDCSAETHRFDGYCSRFGIP